MKAQHGLVKQVTSNRIGMGQREITKTIGEGLGKSRHGDYIRKQLAARKCALLIAIHEKELARHMTLLSLVQIHAGNELIVAVMAVGSESARSGCGVLGSRHNEVAVRQLRIQNGQSRWGYICCRGDHSAQQAGLSHELLRQGTGTTAACTIRYRRQEARAQASRRIVQSVALASALVRNEKHC